MPILPGGAVRMDVRPGQDELCATDRKDATLKGSLT